jgi:hypothetical protein
MSRAWRHRCAGLRMLALALGGLTFVACKSPLPARDYSPAIVRLYVESTDGGTAVTLPRSGVKIAVGQKAILTESDVVNAEEARVELGACLMLQLTPAAARDLYRLSVVNQGRRLVLTVNDSPLGARRIDGPLADGTIFIFAEVADAELPRLVRDLKRTSAEIQKEQGKK